MKHRRTLTDGLLDTPAVEDIERDFVYGREDQPKPEEDSIGNPRVSTEILPQYVSRVPITVRCLPEIASMLKRISLERQLEGKELSKMQEILEQALVEWMRRHGYRP